MIILPSILRTHDLVCAASSGFLIVLLLCLSSPAAQAELILGAEARVTFEDNIVGLLSGGGGFIRHQRLNRNGSIGHAGRSARDSAGPAREAGPAGRVQYIGAGSQSPGDVSVSIAGRARRQRRCKRPLSRSSHWVSPSALTIRSFPNSIRPLQA